MAHRISGIVNKGRATAPHHQERRKDMYVTPSTTAAEITAQIAEVKEALASDRLSRLDREAYRDELEYLESFLPQEPW